MGSNVTQSETNEKKHPFLIFKDPRLKKQMAKLFVPFLLQELVVVLTTLMSNLVLKWWGSDLKLVTGLSNAFQVFFLYNIIAASFCYVGNLFMSQHYGRGAIDDVQKDYYVLMKVAIVHGLIFFILVLTIPDYLLFFVKDTDIKRYAVEYLKWFSPVFLLIAPSMINYTMMKNLHLEKFCTLSSIITFSIILVFESTFIFTLGTKHETWALEIAALSMAVGRLGEFIFLFTIINKKGVVKFKFKDFFKPNPKRFKAIAYYGAPVVLAKISWGCGFVAVTIITNKIGVGPLLDAHGLMSTYQNLVMCLSNSISGVVAVLIGRELGANRLRKAEDHASDVSRLLFVMGLVEIGAFMLFLPLAILSTPSLTPEAQDYLWKVFLIQTIALIPRSYNSSYLNGLFNVGGDTLYIMLVDGLTAWLTIFPLGMIGTHFNWDPLLVYSLIQLEEVFKFPLNIWRYKQKKWVFNITHKKGIVFNE